MPSSSTFVANGQKTRKVFHAQTATRSFGPTPKSSHWANFISKALEATTTLRITFQLHHQFKSNLLHAWPFPLSSRFVRRSCAPFLSFFTSLLSATHSAMNFSHTYECAASDTLRQLLDAKPLKLPCIIVQGTSTSGGDSALASPHPTASCNWRISHENIVATAAVPQASSLFLSEHVKQRMQEVQRSARSMSETPAFCADCHHLHELLFHVARTKSRRCSEESCLRIFFMLYQMAELPVLRKRIFYFKPRHDVCCVAVLLLVILFTFRAGWLACRHRQSVQGALSHQRALPLLPRFIF
jgi:hypothetical protein